MYLLRLPGYPVLQAESGLVPINRNMTNVTAAAEHKLVADGLCVDSTWHSLLRKSSHTPEDQSISGRKL